MSHTGSPRETLSAVALRAFRSPISGLATLLAAISSDTNAAVTAVHLVPQAPAPVELLASSGPGAGRLGPPGRVSTAQAAILRAAAAKLAGGSDEPGDLRSLPPWSEEPHLASQCIMLGNASFSLLTVAGSSPIDPTELYDDSAAIGLLTQMVVNQRELERLRQELHDLQQDRSLLTAGLHHDLKGPLTSILGSAQTLIAHEDELDTTTRDSMLAGIAAQAKRLNRMLVETLEKQSTDLNAPVRRMSFDLKALGERVAAAAMAGRSGSVVVESPEVSVVSDQDRLERALLNLVDNALKYSPDGVPAYLIIEEEPNGVSITVADNGPGVTPDVLPGLFSAYATDPSRSDGTGLGLHSARTLVEELGGRVGYSRQSEWTRFTVSLPASSATARDEADR